MVLFWYQSKFNNVSDFMKHISKDSVALNLMLQVSFKIFYKIKILVNFK